MLFSRASLADQGYIRNIEDGEKCKFCDKVHVSSVTVHSNASKYTSVYKIAYCEDHKQAAEDAKKADEAKSYQPRMWE